MIMDAPDITGEPISIRWTVDFIPKEAEDGTPDMREFNCSSVGVSKFRAVCGGEKTLADVPVEYYFDACKLTDLMGAKAIETLMKKLSGTTSQSRVGVTQRLPDVTLVYLLLARCTSQISCSVGPCRPYALECE